MELRSDCDDVDRSPLESKGGVEYDSYGEEIIPKGAILGLIQKKRMVASSVNGYRLFTDNDCDVEAFCNDVTSQNNLPDSKIYLNICLPNVKNLVYYIYSSIGKRFTWKKKTVAITTRKTFEASTVQSTQVTIISIIKTQRL